MVLPGCGYSPAFTRRMLIVDNKVGIGAQVQQPFDNELCEHTENSVFCKYPN